QTGDFAYWVEDQSVKARINSSDATDQMSFLGGNSEFAQNIRESLLLFPSQDKIFDVINPDGGGSNPTPITEEQTNAFMRAINLAQTELILPNNGNYAGFSGPGEYLRNLRHDFTIYSAGILENALTGGLKTNLTGRTQDDIEELLARSGNENDHYLRGDYLLYHNIDPQTGIPFPENADPDDADIEGSSMDSNGNLVRLPVEDYFDFRDNLSDPEDNQTQVVRNIMPVVTEASFRLGAFHNQQPNSNWHRIRFHADIEFWNPYPFPIRFPGEGQSRAFVLMMIPSEVGSSGGLGRGGGTEAEKMILSIEKVSAGLGRGGGTVEEEIHTNLFNFDEDLSEGQSTNNTINETVMTSWMVIQNVVLQPGEVYHATTGRSQGLARDLGGYVLRAGGDPDSAADYEVDPTSSLNRWSWHTYPNSNGYPELEPTDQINMKLRMPENGLTFRIIPFDSRSTSNTPVYEEEDSNTWAKPVFELRNIYAIDNPPTLELTGSEYSRTSSGSYELDNFNIGFHFRLDDEAILLANADSSNLRLGFDFRQPVWDYNDPAVKRAVMVGGIYPEDAEAGEEPNPFNAPNQLDLFFNQLDLFADGQPDSHSGSYQTVFYYSKPSGEPLSVGSFRNLPLANETVDYDTDNDGTDEVVQIQAGMPWGGSLNQAFDKYFFTGVPDDEDDSLDNWTADQALPLPSELIRSTTSTRMREPDAATELLVKGAFNVNSLSPLAWSAMLSRTLHDWKYTSSGATADLKNAFLNLSASTDNALATSGNLEDDDELTDVDPGDLSGPESAGRLAMRYPLRRLSDEAILNLETSDDDSLVEYLIDELESYFNANGPFSSVSEFVSSGVLERAIQRSGINGDIPRYATAYLTQAIILEPLSPLLTVRSDTFIIRSVGQQYGASGESTGKIICEAVVQRIPDRVDSDDNFLMDNATSSNNRFGRRFVIKQINWEQDDT
ncbi:MAG: hypothetical protein ACPGSB_03630, partial [Opitutales bacterium]